MLCKWKHCHYEGLLSLPLAAVLSSPLKVCHIKDKPECLEVDTGPPRLKDVFNAAWMEFHFSSPLPVHLQNLPSLCSIFCRCAGEWRRKLHCTCRSLASGTAVLAEDVNMFLTPVQRTLADDTLVCVCAAKKASCRVWRLSSSDFNPFACLSPSNHPRYHVMKCAVLMVWLGLPIDVQASFVMIYFDISSDELLQMDYTFQCSIVWF